MLQSNVFNELVEGVYAVKFDSAILDYVRSAPNSVVLNLVNGSIVASVYDGGNNSSEIDQYEGFLTNSVGSTQENINEINSTFGHSPRLLERSILRNEGSSSDVAMQSVGTSSPMSMTSVRRPSNQDQRRRQSSAPATIAEYRALFPSVVFSSVKSLRPEDCKIVDQEIFNFKVVSIFNHYKIKNEDPERKFFGKTLSYTSQLKIAGVFDLRQWWARATNLQKVILLTFPKESKLMKSITAQEMRWDDSINTTDRDRLLTLVNNCRFPDPRTYA